MGLTCPVVTLTPGPGTLQVDWTAVQAATNYTVFLYGSGGSGVVSEKEVAANAQLRATFGQPDGAQPSTQYWVRVVPKNNSEQLTSCALVTATTGAVQSLGQPEMATLELVGTSALFTLIPVQNAAYYEWQISADPNFGTFIQNSSTSEVEFLVNGLPPLEDPLYFRHRATADGYQNSDWSVPIQFGGVRVAQPVLSFDEITTGSFRVNWPVDANADRMIAELSTTGSFSNIIATAGPSSNTGSHTFNPGTSYATNTLYVRVQQRNNDGWYKDSFYGTGQVTLA